MSVTREQRHTKWHRCPICGGAEQDPRGASKRCFGFTSEDGEWIHCSREEHAGALEQNSNGLFVHKNHGECKCGATHNPSTYEAHSSIRALSFGRDKIECSYDYTDEKGGLLYQVIRKPGKKFLQRKPDGQGGWIWKLNGQRRVIYRLSEIVSSGQDVPVWIVEGEKDADTLAGKGYLATCNPGGAGKWHMVASCAAVALKGRNVIVVADADDVGKTHSLQVAASLKNIAASVTVLQPPEPYKDVTELLEDGKDLQDLVPLQEASSESDYDDEITSDRTDVRNAEFLLKFYGNDLRYCHSWHKWLAWNGQYWVIDDSAMAEFFARETTRRMLAIALKDIERIEKEMSLLPFNTPEAKRSEMKLALKKAKSEKNHAINSQNWSSISAMLKIAKSDRSVSVTIESLDKDPMLFNVTNGTLDLRTGELRPHDRNDLITRVAPVAYDPKATCPIWNAFLTRAMNNERMVEHLQRISGYAITGDTSEHIIVFFYGNGANGKSTFLNTIHQVLGHYATPAARNLLFRSKNLEHPTEFASLFGRRFVTCSEIQEGQYFDEALVKDLTGGDMISCRRMREDFWSFKPSHTFFLAGNYKPYVRGDDEGIWRRMRLIPWTNIIPVSERDSSLPARIISEKSGILNWLIRGCLAWQANGLMSTDEVSEATRTYRSENDAIGEFFRSHLVFEAGSCVAKFQLRAEYENFCRDTGFEPVGARRFAARLKDRGVTETTCLVKGFDRKVFNAWRNVRFATDEERTLASHGLGHI